MGIGPIPAAAALTAGVLVVHTLAGLPSLPLLLALVVPALLPWRGRRLAAMFALGAVLTVWRAQALLDQSWPAGRHGEERTVVGWVASLPEPEGVNWRFVFEPQDPELPQRIRASWYGASDVIRAGECWRLTLRIRTPHGSLNPGGFDYEAWLLRQGIGAAATVRDAERCALPPRPLLRLRQRMAEAIRDAVPDVRAASVIAALTVGDRSGIANADWDLFRATGTTHLVAISGFNIAIVAAAAFFGGRWSWALVPALCMRWPAPRAGLVVSGLVGAAYAMIAGLEAPVLRALAMLWLALAAAALDRPAPPARILALAWIGLLLADPLGVASPGLWLSFAAVAAILYVTLGRWHPLRPLPALLRIQAFIAIALAPLSLLFFHGTSVAAPLVNLLAVPLFAVLTPWLLAGMLLQLAAPSLGALMLPAGAAVLEVFFAGLEWAAQADAWLPAAASGPGLLLALVAAALVFAPTGLPLRWLGVLAALPLVLDRPEPPAGGLEVTALDVGQGLAVVVRTARHTLLYDAGPAYRDGMDAGASIVVPYLLDRGLRHVDRMVISHADNDHAGGAAAVRRTMRVRSERGPAGAPCRAGERWQWDGVDFTVLHPDAPTWAGNDGSCVLRIDGPYSVLLAGDIEAAAEAHLVEQGAQRIAADVLVAPHHGSRTSSSQAFVDGVRPRLVIFGAGWRHHFRHPRPEVVARYRAAGAATYVTGHSGAITVRSAGAGALTVREHRREAARFWNQPAGP